jgi:hypothetical protein
MTSTEVSQYLQSGVKTGRIKGWADEGKLQPIWIAVDGIDCIYIN